MDIFISRRECAEKFGVTPQTISNYVERGLLSYRRINGTVYINRDSADEFFKKYIKDFIADEEEVKRITYDMKSAKERLSAELKELVSSFNTASSFGKKVKVMYDMILSSDRIVGNVLSEKDVFVMKRFLCEGANAAELASELGVSATSVHHIIDNSIERIQKSYGLMEKYQDERRRLLERVNRQNGHIHELMAENSRLKRQLERHGLSMSVQKSVLVENCNFQERVLNCLRRGGLITLGDVCRYGREHLMRLNGFGGKALTEVTEVLDKYNLRLGD